MLSAGCSHFLCLGPALSKLMTAAHTLQRRPSFLHHRVLHISVLAQPLSAPARSSRAGAGALSSRCGRDLARGAQARLPPQHALVGGHHAPGQRGQALLRARREARSEPNSAVCYTKLGCDTSKSRRSLKHNPRSLAICCTSSLLLNQVKAVCTKVSPAVHKV